MMHLPIQDQGAYLKRVVNGFLNYFAVPTNSRAIDQAADLGSHEATDRPLAATRTHPTPASRRAVRVIDPRWEPGAVVPHAGFCAGGGEQSSSLPRRLGKGRACRAVAVPLSARMWSQPRISHLPAYRKPVPAPAALTMQPTATTPA
jgi:hypothetical protein